MLAAAALHAPSRCGLAAGKAAVRSTHLTIPASQSESSESERVSPSDLDGAFCVHLPGGKIGLVVTVGSGGTAGDVDWAVFLPGPSGYRAVLIRGGYKLGLVVNNGDIVETDPIYKKTDANCCPSSFVHARWHWNGSKFVVVRTWHDKQYQE
jgi:hypothetical protein